MGPILAGIKQFKSIVIVRDLALNSPLFGLVIS